jgi:hypothetical protein
VLQFASISTGLATFLGASAGALAVGAFLGQAPGALTRASDATLRRNATLGALVFSGIVLVVVVLSSVVS